MISSGTYFRALLKIWLPVWGWFILTPIIVLATIGAMVDVRLVIVALALLFLVVPMLMVFFYIHYMVTPHARRALLPSEIKIVPDERISIHYLPDENDYAPKDEIIPWKEVRTVYRYRNYMVYLLHGRTMPLIIVPIENQV